MNIFKLISQINSQKDLKDSQFVSLKRSQRSPLVKLLLSGSSGTLAVKLGLAATFLLSTAEIAPAQPPSGTVCYVVSDGSNPDRLIQVDINSGVASNIGSLGSGITRVEAIAYWPITGTLYGVNADRLGTINTTTGRFTAVGTTFGSGNGSAGNKNFNDVDGLTLDPHTGELYGSVRDGDGGAPEDLLIQINPTTGAHIPDAFGPGVDYLVIRTASATGFNDVDDITIDPDDGQLYGVANQGGGSTDRFVKIDRTDGTVTQVGSFGLSDAEGMNSFNDGSIYLSTGNRSSNSKDDRFYQVNKASGSVTELGNLNSLGSDYEGIACLTGAPNTISGTVFFDDGGTTGTTNDGILNGDEAGNDGVTVTLFRDSDSSGTVTAADIPLTTQVTSGGGNYSFVVASTGDFVVEIDQNNIPAGQSLTTDNLETANFGVSLGASDTDNNFGHASPLSLDYGDAPDTYGTDDTGGNSSNNNDPVGANHVIDPKLYLGTTAPDADSNGFVEGTDNNGNATDDDDPNGTGTGNGDDEDDFTLPTLTTGDTSYTIPAANITATNTTGSNATLHAWIDFDNSGTFDSTEHTSVAVNDATNGGNPVGDLTWNGITAGAAGNTYARFRLTSDSSINNTTPGGAASDGEVEDYQIAIAPATVSVTGQVIDDVNYNGILDQGETGIDNLTVNLYNAQNELQSTITTANGGVYEFSDLTPGEYYVSIEPPSNTVLSPQGTSGDSGTESDFNRLTNSTENFNLQTGDNFNFIAALAADTDGDFIADVNEQGDRDGDGVDDAIEIDPSGYFYEETTGEIISAGSISVTGPSATSVNLVDDGGDGSYQFFGTEPGTYTVSINPPSGYELSTTCAEEAGSFDPTGGPDPTSLGSGENGNTGFLVDSDCASNPYYLSFDLEANDPLVINNNIPLAIADNQSGIPNICEAGEPTDVISFLNTPTLVQGTDLQVGAVYRFNGVFPGVDALIEVLQFNDSATLANIDNNGAGEVTAFQPTLGVSPGTATPSVDFNISLIDAATGAPAVMNFRAAGIDIDGNNNTLREFIELTDLTSYTLSPDTTITATSNPPKTRFESNTTDVQPGIDFTALNTLVISKYDQVSEFNYSIGAITGGSLTTERLNSLYIGCAERVKDFSDAPADGNTAPDGGTTGYGEASHIIVDVITLGTNIDSEATAQNSAAADGDDNDGTDDDDGVTIPSLTAGETATITAQVAGTGGYLQGWIDWNGDGIFDTGEQVATDIQDNGTGDDDNTTGTISFDVNVPADAITTANTFGRFRWSTTQGLDRTTAASDGEVEDYQIAIADATTSTSLCPNTIADLWFANDESGSVNDDELEDALDFLYRISDGFVYDDDTGVKAGIIGWTDQINSTEIIIPITESFGDPGDSGLFSDGNITLNNNTQGIRELYEERKSSGFGTRLDFAVSDLAELINDGNGSRVDTPQIAVILTDADRTEITVNGSGIFSSLNAAQQLQNTGAKVVMILIEEAITAYENDFTSRLIIDSIVGTDGVIIQVPTYSDAADPTQGHVEDVSQTVCNLTAPVTSDPNVLSAKRITAINPGQPDEIQFNNFVDDPITEDDNDPLWPDSDENPNSNVNRFLRGEISVQAKPADEVEFTIYFLSNGDENALNTQICDVIPNDMTFVEDAYGIEIGIALGFNPTIVSDAPSKNLSNIVGDDEGEFYGPGTAPPANLCKKTIDSSNNLVTVDETNNIDGAIVVRPADALPAAVLPGQPAGSYGFIRFRARVK